MDYDEDGFVVGVSTEIPDVDLSERVVFERPSEFVVRSFSYDSAGNLMALSKTSNDPDGNPIEVITFLPDGTRTSITNSTYDSYGRVLDVTMANGEGTVVSTVTRTYDTEGRVVELITANPAAGIEQKVVAEFAEDNLLSGERTYNKLGQLVSLTRYTYEHYDEDEDQE